MPETGTTVSKEQLVRAFSFLDESHYSAVQACFELVPVQTGEHLFADGDQAETLYVLLEGRVAVKKRTGFGNNSHVIALLSPYAPVGERAFGGGSIPQHKASVVAVEDCLLCRLDRRAFSDLKTTHPVIAFAVLEHLLATTGLRLEKCSERLARIL